ncbi:MAG TPA: hypothetical protein VGD23_04910 [Sphingomicrobium sp.]
MPRKLLVARFISRRAWLIGGAIVLGACRMQEPTNNSEDSALPEPANQTIPEVPVTPPVVDRTAFLEAMAGAASAHTAGEENQPDPLANRRFAIRLRFGCAGPSPEDSTESIRWTPSDDGQSIRVRAEPNLVSTGLAPLTVTTFGVEAVEGFWVPRPWLRQDGCPAQPDEGAAAPATPTVGLAQYFTAEDSRVRRRSGRAYESVVRIAGPDEVPKRGLTLLLEGRFRAWPNGRVVRCWGTGVSGPPSCVASMQLDRAAIERPDGNDVLAEWRN